ncbi:MULTISPECIES: hypothetical protein [Streptomyces]|uniref:hypothetical protein n=1 Tax=Streptomyces lycopersici TaxID=2974589 RepID=UPI0021D1C5E9|nr:hypothetical protein [Streptomyces sp. NEAU-383]
MRFYYDWTPMASQQAPLLHGDAVARSLLTDHATKVLCGHPILMADTAETAVNRILSEEIRDDQRLCVAGGVTVVVTEDTLLAACRRNEAAERHRVEKAAHVARLEVLRDLLLDGGLGLVWWIDRYADLQFAAGDPKSKTESVLGAFRLVSDALHADAAFIQGDENALMRARVEELLDAFRNPDTRMRAMDLLETVLSLLAPESATASERAEAVEQKDLVPVTKPP